MAGDFLLLISEYHKKSQSNSKAILAHIQDNLEVINIIIFTNNCHYILVISGTITLETVEKKV